MRNELIQDIAEANLFRRQFQGTSSSVKTASWLDHISYKRRPSTEFQMGGDSRNAAIVRSPFLRTDNQPHPCIQILNLPELNAGLQGHHNIAQRQSEAPPWVMAENNPKPCQGGTA
jgi:hypothetical protein